MEKLLNYDVMGILKGLFANLSFELILKIVVVYFFILRIAIIIWVIKDIINRTNNIFYQIISILIVTFGTPFSVVIYFLIRPSNTLFEKYYEDDFVDEHDEDEEEFEDKEDIKLDVEPISAKKVTCPECNYIIKSDYKFCPNCRVKLKNECIGCGKELKPDWEICPYCGKDQSQKIENILSKTIDNKPKDKEIIEEQKDILEKVENQLEIKIDEENNEIKENKKTD